ncbi:MAG: glycosyltransferase family 2 protein [Candidatus Paracaedibacteraceae bacterium]|nr:glycosyltransferase family 2 protein [Candidatus Paracaedibacteraceae bacterium]
MPMKILALIPTYNHYKALPSIIKRLIQANMEILIVDDGSNEITHQTLMDLLQQYPLTLLPLENNQGKGAAIHQGLRWAHQHGFTHAFQIDADGQHSLDNLQGFMDLSSNNPEALISGQPIYDQSMPLARRIGRWFTHVWVWIETLSFRITDSMCGFRIYPVDSTLRILESKGIGPRMDFDTHIMVHLFWQGIPVVMSPVAVTYPEGNISNFDVIRDNWRITKMHTKLFFTMVFNLKKILSHRPNYKTLDLPVENTHWASLEERSSLMGMFILAYCCRFMGKRLCMALSTPVILYYYCFNKIQRQASQDFLKRAFSRAARPDTTSSLRHFFSFLEMALDKFGAWSGQMTFDEIIYTSPTTFKDLMAQPTGGMLLVSHLGNMEFCRAATCLEHKNRLHILLHSKNSQRYNQFLKAFNPLSNLNIIEITEINPATIIYLRDRLSQGDWVVIAGDRLPPQNKSRITHVPFLGIEAPFSQGPYILASLLECPVYMAIAVRDQANISVNLEKLDDKIVLPRANKNNHIDKYVIAFSQYLEKFSLLYPYQWFNFFNFWK